MINKKELCSILYLRRSVFCASWCFVGLFFLIGCIVFSVFGAFRVSAQMSTDAVLVTEIHPVATDYPEYLEIVIQEEIVGELFIAGGGRGDASKRVVLTGRTPGYYILTADADFFAPSVSVIEIPGFSLHDGGETLGVTPPNTPYSTITYDVGVGGKSFYPDVENTTLFGRVGLPTPGAPFSNTTETVEDNTTSTTGDSGEQHTTAPLCNLKRQHRDAVQYGDSLNLIATWEGREIQNGMSDYTCTIDMGDNTIYTQCNPLPHLYAEGGLYNAAATINYENISCRVNLTINYPSYRGNNESCAPSSYNQCQGLESMSMSFASHLEEIIATSRFDPYRRTALKRHHDVYLLAKDAIENGLQYYSFGGVTVQYESYEDLYSLWRMRTDIILPIAAAL